MKTKYTTENIWTVLLWAVMLATNIFFIGKYFPRAGLNPVISAIVYGAVITGLAFLYKKRIAALISTRVACGLSVILTVGILLFIALAIRFIEPYSLQVDRWSATTFFLDGLVQGIYPYGIHTHAAETNFPSPFPLWHYLNIPFWLIGDVGWIQAFFILVFLGAVYYCFRSWHTVLGTLLLLYISPSYWWELAVRSDSLSNAFLVCACILFIQRFPLKMDRQWWLLAILSGCLASTRLSAIIPMALYLFYPWLQANWKVQIGFIGIAIGIIAFFFSPYIFWDTENWVFFQRNPFMSQTSPGSPWILGIMVLIAIAIAYKKKTFYYYLSTTSLFLFAFMLFTQLGVIYRSPEPVTLFDVCCDISYFTLAIPYAILGLTMPKETKL